MGYLLLADLVVVIHPVFVVFAVLGGLLVIKWRNWVWVHLPAAAWAVLLEFAGWVCPLTPLENRLRELGQETGYQTGFVEHYLLPILYPDNLTPPTRITLGAMVLIVNLAIYGWITFRWANRDD